MMLINTEKQQNVREQLRALHLTPQRTRGQNFLIDTAVIDQIMAVSPLTHDDVALEIGPGLGALTVRLAERAAQLTALELEAVLAQRLIRLFDGQKHVKIINTDALLFDYAAFNQGAPYRIYANVPYNITTPLLTVLLSVGGWQDMTLMLQKEAALRICVGQGRSNGPLTLLTSYYAEAEVCFIVPPQAFYPPPAVDSAVIRLRRREQPPVAGDIAQIMTLIEAGFCQRRKLLTANLTVLGTSREEWRELLRECDLDENCRAEQLSLADFARLNEVWRQTKNDPSER